MKNDFLLKVIRFLLISSVFLAPLVYTKEFVYPGVFPRAIFLYTIVSLALILWALYFFKERYIRLKKNWLVVSLLGYIGVLFLSAIVSGHFESAFFSPQERMTGIATFLYAFSWFFIASSVFKPRDWVNMFRALLFSGVILAFVSYFGRHGVDLEQLKFIGQGGSFFDNTTFAGIYYLFAFFAGIILWVKDTSWKWRAGYTVAMFSIVVTPEIMNFEVWRGMHSFGEIVRNPTLLIGQARASAISIGLGSFLAGVFYLIHRLRASVRVKGGLFGLILLVLLGTTFAFVGSVVAESGFGHEFMQTEEDINRPLVWKQSAEAFNNSPILGYGPNNFIYAFQDTFKPEVAFLENTNWFDKVHNGTLEILIETGILGAIATALVFASAVWYAFRSYARTNDFTMPLIILALVMHFIQIQTSFNIVISIFAIFMLLAYISSGAGKNVAYSIKPWFSVAVLTIVIGLFIIAAITPAIHNHKIITAMRSGSFDQRMEMYETLHSLYGYPPKNLFLVSQEYVNALFDNIYTFDTSEKQQRLQTEFTAILDLYESHMDKSGDDFRFLINYANMIHIGKLFGVERLDRSAELLDKAEQISTNYPQLYWLRALQERYEGNYEEAIAEIDRAIELYEGIDLDVDAGVFERVSGVSLSISSFIERTKNDGNKVYYHVRKL